MSIFWLGGPQGVIVPIKDIKATEEDRYFMPGIIHGGESYIIQVYGWSTGPRPEDERIAARYLFIDDILAWAKESSDSAGILDHDVFEELINEKSEEFVVENDGSGEFVTLNNTWHQAIVLSYEEIVSWAQKQADKDLSKTTLADKIKSASERALQSKATPGEKENSPKRT